MPFALDAEVRIRHAEAMASSLQSHDRSSSEEWHDLRSGDESLGTVFKDALRDYALVALADDRRLWFGRRTSRGPLELVVDPQPIEEPTLEAPDGANAWYERDAAALAAAPAVGRARKTAWLRQHWDLEVGAAVWTMRPRKKLASRAFDARANDGRSAEVGPLVPGKLKVFVQGWTVDPVEGELELDELLFLGLLYHKILDDRRAPGLV